MKHHLEFATPSERDIRRLPASAKRRIRVALEELVAIPTPANLDVTAITGHAPFLRLRVGEFRVIYRPLTGDELTRLSSRRGADLGRSGFLIARVVNRRDLERAVAGLRMVELS